MVHHTDIQDDMLIAVALTRFSVEFEEANQHLADRAWELAIARTTGHGVRPQEAIEKLEWDSEDAQ